MIVKGGRKEGIKKLKSIKKYKYYNDERNSLSIRTTELSAYIKFGCISIREVFHVILKHLGKENVLLSQIFWREFYYYIGYYFPRVLEGKNYNRKFDKIKWRWNKKHFEAWKNGQTGFPVVDAGMRQLNTTGYMHNRGRLITSNFLNRILGIDWRHGEKYYATKLVDYDPIVNNGNWQWSASVGVDPKPYTQRIFNPWIQSEKFDKDCKYIKKWIPELKDVSNKHIHEWDNYYKFYDVKYNKPIVDYKVNRKESIKMYKKSYK